MTLHPDEPTVRRLELHEARAHAMRGGRFVRDLGDAILLHDELDPDPFWNRLESVRLPEDDRGFDRRLDELVVLFATLGRRPHVWASPGYQRPADLEARLARQGFVDLGRGLLMALTDADRPRSLLSQPLRTGVTLERIARDAGERRDLLAADIALVSGEAFGVDPGGRAGIVEDFLGLIGTVGFSAYLARVDGEPAAIAKATTFDGATYLSTIGTRPSHRGRGLAGVVTAAAALDAVDAGSEWIYLGVFESNLTARRLYGRLGFEPIGEPAGDWLMP